MPDKPCHICDVGYGAITDLSKSRVCNEHAADLREAGWVPASEVRDAQLRAVEYTVQRMEAMMLDAMTRGSWPSAASFVESAEADGNPTSGQAPRPQEEQPHA